MLQYENIITSQTPLLYYEEDLLVWLFLTLQGWIVVCYISSSLKGVSVKAGIDIC